MKRTLSVLALVFALVSFGRAQSTYPYVKLVPNDPGTGTTQFTLTKVNSSGNAVIMATSDVNGYTGVCVTNCGTSGYAGIAFGGFVSVKVDGTTTAQHYVQISSTTGGDGTDSGATTWPTTGDVVGRVAVASSGSGSFSIVDLGPEPRGVLSAVGGFPEVLIIPAANCNNTTAGAGWSIGASGTVTCRAGTNNLGGFVSITDTSSTFAQFAVAIPEDWNSAVLPWIRFQVASTDTTSGHTIIPQIKVSCAKGDGTTTDDVTFNAAQSSGTITLGSTANQFWSNSSVQLSAGSMTGCVAGSLMIVQVGRAADTGANAEFYGATMTFVRTLVSQAN